MVSSILSLVSQTVIYFPHSSFMHSLRAFLLDAELPVRQTAVSQS